MFKTIGTYYQAIKALFVVKGEINKMKMSELATSSGRSMLMLNLCTVYSCIHGFLPPNIVAWIAMASVTVYTLYRTAAPLIEKVAAMTATPKDDAALAEIKATVDALVAKFGTPQDAAATNVKTE